MCLELKNAESNHSIYDKELLAIVCAFKEWRAWLIGSKEPNKVWSNHKNLEYFRTSQKLNQRQARWSMTLTDYDFKIEHIARKKNPADQLS